MAGRWHPIVSSSFFAALALFAHLLIASHTVAHLAQPPADGVAQHCAICAVGEHAAGVSAVVLEIHEFTPTWRTNSPRLHRSALPGCEGITLARGPPLAERAPIG